ncbi:hypothetical protein DPMN_038776 [Dreissena polymorpha]|uniref:Uncharacterized protein n=1 Tax=Dreissena polymorpha TaxID=45954 RepID=A0A9D4MG54_DREPO|nr:hypothetical protein DPMN_038776 [Dreissena polymorpha]
MAEFAAASGRLAFSSPIPSQQNPYSGLSAKDSRTHIQDYQLIFVMKPQGKPTNPSCLVGTPENEDKRRRRWSDSSRKHLGACQRGINMPSNTPVREKLQESIVDCSGGLSPCRGNETAAAVVVVVVEVVAVLVVVVVVVGVVVVVIDVVAVALDTKEPLGTGQTVIAVCILPPKRESAVKGAILSEFTSGSNTNIEAGNRGGGPRGFLASRASESNSSQAIYKTVASCGQDVANFPTWKATGIFGKYRGLAQSGPYGLSMAMEQANYLGSIDWKTYIVVEPLGRRMFTRDITGQLFCDVDCKACGQQGKGVVKSNLLGS